MAPEISEQKNGADATDANDLPPTPIASEASAAIRAALSDVSGQSETMLPSTSEDTSDNGRPPLAPPAPLSQQAAPLSSTKPAANPTFSPPKRPLATSHHGRVQSTGEYSFMSALTDASGDNGVPRDPIKAPRRDRTVSWDQNFFDNSEMESTLPTAILQPILQEEQAPSINDGSKSVAVGNRSRTRTLDLADITTDNPMETEAETAIIAAIEEENRIEGGRQHSDSVSVLMPHVPENGLDMFENNSASSSKPTSPQASSHHSHEQPTSPRSTSRHRRNKSSMPAEGLKVEQSDTLENTLSGLATAMRKIHTETSEQADRSEITDSHRRLPSRDIGHPAALMEDTPVNNADVLVHNANRLLRRNVQKDDSSMGEESLNEPEEDRAQESQDRTMKHIWNIFETKPDPKKTDDGDRLDQIDEGFVESASDDGSTKSEYGSTEPHSSPHAAVGDIEEGNNEYNGNDKDDPQMPTDALGDRSKKTLFRKGPPRVLTRAQKRVKQDLEMFSEFLRPKKGSIAVFCKSVLFLLIFLSGVAAILFYLAGNPLLAKNGASISWILMFIARQVVTFAMTQCTQLLVVDFLCLKTRYLVRLFGPTISLFIVQSKGIPFILSTWAIYDFVLLSGAHALANHWLFWQELIDLCNANNPSGDIPSSTTNYRILGSALGAGIAISIKRFWVGLYLGRRTFANYGDQLAQVIENMIIISEVATLGRSFERFGSSFSKPLFEKSLAEWSLEEDRSVDENSGGQRPPLKRPPGIGQQGRTASVANADRVIEEGRRNKFTGTLSPSQRIKVAQLLDHWLEPEIYKKKRDSAASINAILQFRQALTFMDNSFPFSLAFGPAETREACIESAQKVYERLLLRTPDQDRLPFDTIAIVALNRNGEINQKKMKQLIRIYRPDQDGNLTMLDFVRSCDTVYKSLRLLRASIANAGQIDQAFENMINVAFFILLICIILAANGFNPLALFLSFSSIILAFAFMIGSASSKYFEGILFILVRRPYDIGDRIAVSDVNSEASINGTLTWFVQKVDLFTTTVRYSGTNEVATLANGSLATSRIINWARSEKAVVHIFLKLGVDIPYSRVQVFKKTVENFVKARPREWVALSRFRATRVEADLGYIEYALDLQHRDSWQNLANILMSKADLASFCLEVSKQLDMRYQAPSLPVDLTLNNKDGLEQLRRAHTSQGASEDGSHNKSRASHARTSSSPDVRAISALFERAQDQ